MIYGVTIFLNDVSYDRNRRMKVESRMSEEAFFTNRKAARDYYEYHLKRWENEQRVVYRGADVRGRAEMYKADVDGGRICNRGESIYLKTTGI